MIGEVEENGLESFTWKEEAVVGGDGCGLPPSRVWVGVPALPWEQHRGSCSAYQEGSLHVDLGYTQS